MHDRAYVRGKAKRMFLNYLVKQDFIRKSDIYPKAIGDEKKVIEKAGLGDALFFSVFYTKPWHKEYLKMIAKKFNVSVTEFKVFGDKRTYTKIN